MGAYAIKPTFPYVTTKPLINRPVSKEYKNMADFINTHDFSFVVNKETKTLTSSVIDISVKEK